MPVAVAAELAVASVARTPEELVDLQRGHLLQQPLRSSAHHLLEHVVRGRDLGAVGGRT